MHNTSQPFLDHSLYFDNVTEVIEPTALNLLGRRLPAATRSGGVRRERASR